MIQADQKKFNIRFMPNRQGGSTHEVYVVQGEPSLAPEQETELIRVVPLHAEKMIWISTDLSVEVQEALVNCL